MSKKNWIEITNKGEIDLGGLHLIGISSNNELKNTILEEHFHMLGHEDEQRAFVTFLIDELIKAKQS